MNERMAIIMRLSWGECRRKAKELGGKPSEYLKEVLKKQHSKMLSHEQSKEIYVIKYNKSQDNFIGTYLTIGVNPQLKSNKRNEEFLQITTPKGSRNFSYFSLVKCDNFKQANEMIKEMLEKNPSWILTEY